MKRNTSADSLRGLAIVLVVLGHSIVSVAWVYHSGPGLTMLTDGRWVADPIAFNPLLNMIYAFHMPLLAFVSGLVSWRPQLPPALRTIRSRFLGLMVPYFAWVVVYYMLSARPLVFDDLTRSLGTAAANPWGGLWYLYALFECYLLLVAIQQAPLTRWALPASALGAVALGAVPPGGMHFLGIADVTYIYPFFIGGYLVAEHAEAIRSHRYAVGLLGAAAFAVFAALRGPIWRPDLSPAAIAAASVARYLRATWHVPLANQITTLLGPIVVRYASSFSAIIALTALYGGWTGRVMKWQAWIGRRTLGVYAVHQILQVGLFAMGVTNWIPMFVLSLSISLGVTMVLERIPVLRALLLGQWKKPADSREPQGPADEFAAEGDEGGQSPSMRSSGGTSPTSSGTLNVKYLCPR